MSRFNSDVYDKVFPRPVKTKVVESPVENFTETETEVIETEEQVVDTASEEEVETITIEEAEKEEK